MVKFLRRKHPNAQIWINTNQNKYSASCHQQATKCDQIQNNPPFLSSQAVLKPPAHCVQTSDKWEWAWDRKCLTLFDMLCLTIDKYILLKLHQASSHGHLFIPGTTGHVSPSRGGFCCSDLCTYCHNLHICTHGAGPSYEDSRAS